jgi:hypothetical protein
VHSALKSVRNVKRSDRSGTSDTRRRCTRRTDIGESKYRRPNPDSRLLIAFGMYPTPTGSPGPLKSQADQPQFTPPASPKSTKRKRAAPQRSIQKHDLVADSGPHRIGRLKLTHVRLDYYKLFMCDPNSLLNGHTKVRSSPMALTAQRPYKERDAKSPALPDFVLEPTEINLTDYKNTQGAPPVSWKGASS